MSSDSNVIPKKQTISFVENEKDEGDEGTHDSDQSSTVLPASARTLETSSSSAASSPHSTHRGGHDVMNQEHHGEEEDESASRPMDDPSRVSWESGLVPVKPSSRVTVKLLVSNNMAGSIIGRAGQTISDLQQQASARIRLSQSGDYFPGTSDRICLVHGSIDNVKKGITLVLGKLYELQLELVDTQLGHTEPGNEIESNMDSDETCGDEVENPVKMNFIARILIPSAACGMLIGREGATIKKLKESAGASSARLSAKVTDHSVPRTFERILTVSGTELASCISFSKSILDGFVRHPEICRYLNSTTSYSRSSSSSYAAIPRSPSVPYPTSNNVPNASRPQPFTQSHPPSHEIDTGMQTLTFDSQANVQTSSHAQQRQPAYINSGNPNAINAGAIIPPNAQVGVFNSAGQSMQPRSTPPPTSSPYGSTINLAIPDSMIGTILGRRGQTLRDLQDESGARIKVSQRDEFVPGTSNRIVTISGPEESIATARNLIRNLLSRNP